MKREAWRAFVEEGDLTKALAQGVPSQILRSWQRRKPHLNPQAHPRLTIVQGSSFVRTLQNHLSLLDIARPLMEDIYQWAEGAQVTLLVTDVTCCILDLLGDPEVIAWMQRKGLQPGTYWNEQQAGTNAVALSLQEAQPFYVEGADHYLEFYHDLGAAAAPIHKPNGKALGSLAMVWPTATPHPLASSLIMSAVRSIEYHLYADMYYHEANRRMSELNGMLSVTAHGLVGWNRDGILIYINKRAGEILGLNPYSVLGHPLREALQLPDHLRFAVKEGRTLQNVETSLTTTGERTVNCLVSLQPICEGVREPVGYLLNLEPIKDVRRLLGRMVSSDANLSMEDLIIQSENTAEVWRKARISARSDAPVLLRGEAGVGKNTIARTIHNASEHAGGPFLPITCSAIPHELMISEFLGYEAGAFTGASAQGRPSKFELAEGGTLFLDEVEGLSLKMQSALLKVIEGKVVMRLGGTQPLPVSARIIAATSADLDERMSNGRFRRDLYYYLSAYTIEVPPLRERVDDVELFTHRFLRYYAEQTGRDIEISAEAMELLRAYPWPGNIRELENVLEQVLVVTQSGRIEAADLPAALRRRQVLLDPAGPLQPVLTIREAEREAIERAGWACHGRITEMAELLGISRTTLWRKMRQFDLDAEDFK
jgi:transcriptional activator for dhaKLM operon